jgi:hypothetical protein
MMTFETGEIDLCATCGKQIEKDSRASWCSSRCKGRDWDANEIKKGQQYLTLPLVRLPAEIEEQIHAQHPFGRERLVLAYGYLLRTRAPSSARGYRVGTARDRGQRMRWFPSSVDPNRQAFRLDPFELPAVPLRGRYAVVFTDEFHAPIGEPSFTIEIGFRDKQLLFSDGDRTFRTRVRRTQPAAFGARIG